MARPRTMWSLVQRIGSSKLVAFWSLRGTLVSRQGLACTKDEYALLRKYIRETISEIRYKRSAND